MLLGRRVSQFASYCCNTIPLPKASWGGKCFISISQVAFFSYNTGRTTCLGDGTTSSGLNLPTSVIRKIPPQTFLQANLIEAWHLPWNLMCLLTVTLRLSMESSIVTTLYPKRGLGLCLPGARVTNLSPHFKNILYCCRIL